MGWAAGLLVAQALTGQELRMHSEFLRIGADGEVVALDRTEHPREILSPAVPRNAYSSWFLTVSLPANTPYYIEIGQNPENAMQVAMYRQHYTPSGIPDVLEKVPLPLQGKTAKEEHLTFWVDAWVSGNAPVRRIKLEPQLWIGERWVIYPMEVRVIAATVPPLQPKFWGLPAVEARSDLASISPWRDYLCRPLKDSIEPKETTIRLLQQRNVMQDVALGRKLGRDAVLQAFVRAGIPAEQAIADNWCSVPVDQWRGPLATEWYLRIRDFLYRSAVD